MKYVNLTPHPITLLDGTIFPPSGKVARVTNLFTEFNEYNICKVVYGNLIDVPEPEEDTLYIVSQMVWAATDRKDIIAPATGHPNCKRNEKGFIEAVPGFIEH